MISIHSLRVEGDIVIAMSRNCGTSISIHSLRVEGDPPQSLFCVLRGISIHSLRVEGDIWNCIRALQQCRFQSTPSVWRETTPPAVIRAVYQISIHSLRVEGDSATSIFLWLCGISIHSLRVEGDQVTPMAFSNSLPFQSTPSVWRETLVSLEIR